MAITATEIDELLREAGVPIHGVSVPSDDPSTWRVDFVEAATQAQRDQAAMLIASYTPPTPPVLLARVAAKRMGEKALIATALGLWECIPSPTMTKNQLKARVIEIYKTL